MAEDDTKRCAHKDCTCHTQGGAMYCSESCRTAAESGRSGCDCGHAGCKTSRYKGENSGNVARTQSGAHR